MENQWIKWFNVLHNMQWNELHWDNKMWNNIRTVKRAKDAKFHQKLNMKDEKEKKYDAARS